MLPHGLYSDGHDDLPLGILGVQLWPDNGAMQTRLSGWSQAVWSPRGGCDESRDEIDVVDDNDEARRSRHGGVDNWGFGQVCFSVAGTFARLGVSGATAVCSL